MNKQVLIIFALIIGVVATFIATKRKVVDEGVTGKTTGIVTETDTLERIELRIISITSGCMFGDYDVVKNLAASGIPLVLTIESIDDPKLPYVLARRAINQTDPVKTEPLEFLIPDRPYGHYLVQICEDSSSTGRCYDKEPIQFGPDAEQRTGRDKILFFQYLQAEARKLRLFTSFADNDNQNIQQISQTISMPKATRKVGDELSRLVTSNLRAIGSLPPAIFTERGKTVVAVRLAGSAECEPNFRLKIRNDNPVIDRVNDVKQGYSPIR